MTLLTSPSPLSIMICLFAVLSLSETSVSQASSATTHGVVVDSVTKNFEGDRAESRLVTLFLHGQEGKEGAQNSSWNMAYPARLAYAGNI